MGGVLAASASVSMTDAVTSLMGVVSTVMKTITGDAVLMTFFCAGIIGIAIAVVKSYANRRICNMQNSAGVVLSAPAFINLKRRVI